MIKISRHFRYEIMILEKMKEDIFTITEKHIIQYIEDKKEEINNITINELAKETFSSNATIIRMCKKLGFDGFREFKIGFLRELESQKYITNNTNFTMPFNADESTEKVIRSISSLYKESIDLINSEINKREIEEIAVQIKECRRLFIFSVGDTKITAMNFINKMIKINYYPVLATENNEEITMCNNMDQNDCALFMTYSGKNTVYEECIEILSKKKSRIITFTANQNSKLLDYSHYKICIPDKEHENKIATFYSQLSFQYILSIIYSLIYMKI